MTNPLDIGNGSQPTMHILQGALQGQSIPLRAPEMKLGREGGDLDLSQYAQMSRLHSRIFVENGVWNIQDMGSTNGTHINGERVVSRRLQDGDVVQLGNFSARITLPGQPQSTARSAMTQVVSPMTPEAVPLPPPTQRLPQQPLATPNNPWPSQPAPQVPPQAYPPTPHQAPPPGAYPPPHHQAPPPAAYPPPPYYPAPPPKNAGLAAVLSFFFTGLGQFYNGDISKGISYLIAGIICTVLMFFCIGFIIYPIIWILSIVDAYQSAERINHEAQIRSMQQPRY